MAGKSQNMFIKLVPKDRVKCTAMLNSSKR